MKLAEAVNENGRTKKNPTKTKKLCSGFINIGSKAQMQNFAKKEAVFINRYLDDALQEAWARPNRPNPRASGRPSHAAINAGIARLKAEIPLTIKAAEDRMVDQIVSNIRELMVTSDMEWEDAYALWEKNTNMRGPLLAQVKSKAKAIKVTDREKEAYR